MPNPHPDWERARAALDTAEKHFMAVRQKVDATEIVPQADIESFAAELSKMLVTVAHEASWE